MTASQMSHASIPDLAIREPAPEEVGRVLYLFRNVPPPAEASLLAAARSRPVERFIAAVAWWPQGTAGRFQLVCQPGVAPVVVGGLLIDRLAECARRARMRTIQYANLLTDDNGWLGILRSHGFQCLHSERSFQVPLEDAWARVERFYQKHGSQIPASWRTDSIRNHPPETALELMAPHRLMPPAEVRSCWRADPLFGFDLDLSCILLDGDRPFGTFLTRRAGEGIRIDVQVVREPNPRRRSLGDLFMLYRMFMAYYDARGRSENRPIRWLWFRSGAIEHRQTANLALRLGGRELSRCHLMAKTLGNPTS
jgi:GNAT superfamily N-acetyltransferase